MTRVNVRPIQMLLHVTRAVNSHDFANEAPPLCCCNGAYSSYLLGISQSTSVGTISHAPRERSSPAPRVPIPRSCSVSAPPTRFLTGSRNAVSSLPHLRSMNPHECRR